MSKLWRIAVVVEGPTDSIVLEAIVRSLLVLILNFRPYSRRVQLPLDHMGLAGLECIVGAVRRLRKGAVRCPVLQDCPDGTS